jgi:hypothetical protein
MQVPSELKPVCWGVAGGAVALWAVGFTWGGWTTAGTAETQAKQRADKAVVAALAPICASQFQHHADASKNFAELQKVSSWQQGSFVEKGGWATMPGSSSADPAVASACAALLRAPKL